MYTSYNNTFTSTMGAISTKMLNKYIHLLSFYKRASKQLNQLLRSFEKKLINKDQFAFNILTILAYSDPKVLKVNENHKIFAQTQLIKMGWINN